VTNKGLGVDKSRWQIPAAITNQVDKQPSVTDSTHHETEKFPYKTLIHFEKSFSDCILENPKM